MTYYTYFPIAAAKKTKLGVESVSPISQVERINNLHPSWMRWNGVRWPDNIGHETLSVLNNLKMKTIVVVQANGFIPDFKQQIQIAGLITGLSKQYRNIYAWELWNEPDAPMLRSTVFLGGGWEGKESEYASFLTIVKRNNPSLYILSGGLAKVGAWASNMLGRKPEFDGVSFHHYSRYPWNNTFALENKVKILKTLTNKKLHLTETSLLCSSPAPSDFDKLKADYLRKINLSANDLQLECAIWYTCGSNGWENSDLEGESLKLFKELT